jgi:hypothetical protein
VRWGRALLASLAGGHLALLPAPARAEVEEQLVQPQAAPTPPYVDAMTILARIRRGDATALLVLDGYADGFEWANTYLEAQGQPKIFCAPERLSITAEQNADILRRHLIATPSLAAAPAAMALLYAYRATFPCPIAR